MHFGRENVVHLVVEQIAALLADTDEMAYLVVLFLDHRCQGFLRLSGCRLGFRPALALSRGRETRGARSLEILESAKRNCGIPLVGQQPATLFFTANYTPIISSSLRHG